MRVVPVIDLMQGRVVRGIAGRRAEYQAVTSTIAADAQPVTVARALVERLGLDRAYVADLDAIAGAAPSWEIYRELVACGLKLWIDAGIANQEAPRSWFTSPKRVMGSLDLSPGSNRCPIGQYWRS